MRAKDFAQYYSSWTCIYSLCVQQIKSDLYMICASYNATLLAKYIVYSIYRMSLSTMIFGLAHQGETLVVFAVRYEHAHFL